MQRESSNQQSPRQDNPNDVPLVTFASAAGWITRNPCAPYSYVGPDVLAKLPGQLAVAGVRVCGSINGGPLQWVERLDDYQLKCVAVFSPGPPVDTYFHVEAIRHAPKQTICNLQVDRAALLRAFPHAHGSMTIPEFTSVGTVITAPPRREEAAVAPAGEAKAPSGAPAVTGGSIGPLTLAAAAILGSKSIALKGGQLFPGHLIDDAQADLKASGISLRRRKAAIAHVVEFCKERGVDLHLEKHRKTIMNHIILPVERGLR